VRIAAQAPEKGDELRAMRVHESQESIPIRLRHQTKPGFPRQGMSRSRDVVRDPIGRVQRVRRRESERCSKKSGKPKAEGRKRKTTNDRGRRRNGLRRFAPQSFS
jgi:hypothetical protein